MQLQNCQVIGIKSQGHFEGTNNNKVVRASGRPMAPFVFTAMGRPPYLERIRWSDVVYLAPIE